MQHRPVHWDSDRDGMPDTWETAHGLNPKDPADRNGDKDSDGYTNLEEWLHAFAAEVERASGSTPLDE